MKVLAFLAIATLSVLPTHATPARPKPRIEVVVLGSGGPRPFGRAASSYIIVLDGTPRILVDAGPGAYVRLGELGIDLSRVDIILLTHLHIDHSSDLPAFLNARALTSDGPIQFRIFGPDGSKGDAQGAAEFPKTSRFVDVILGDGGAFPYQRTFGAQETFVVKDLATDLHSAQTTIVEEDGLRINEIATHHGDAPSIAYRITYKGASVVFSGDMDVSAMPNLVELAKAADLLVFNCAVLDPPKSPAQLYELHSPPKRIGEAARDSRVKRLFLSHIAPDVERSAAEVRSSIHTSYAGPVVFAHDRMRIAVRP
ncbi:MAG TPA: MBL fold metallo-hydrolase [Candidatus Angelobacter sp.]|nr:MBL fold metallo-hydrolase [Candidatus Angelobacter sp.]